MKVWRISCRGSACFIPEHVAADDEAEHEDEEGYAQENDIDVEGQVIEVFCSHVAFEV